MVDLKKENGISINDFYLDRLDLIGIIRLQMNIVESEGLYFTIEECLKIWSQHSVYRDASWLDIPNKIDLAEHIKSYKLFSSFEEYSK